MRWAVVVASAAALLVQCHSSNAEGPVATAPDGTFNGETLLATTPAMHPSPAGAARPAAQQPAAS